MRTIAALIGLVSFATLLAEGTALAVLAARGQLSGESLAAITAALAGEAPGVTAAEPAPVPPPPPSSDEVETARVLKTVELNARADELKLLKDLIAAEADLLARDRAAYEKARGEFEKQIAELGARNADEATEQTRSIVKAMPAKEAVGYLSTIPEPDVVRVVKGLPERTTAKILQEFAAGTDEEQQRGRALFEAISDGLPEGEAIGDAREALDGSSAGGAAP